ncbi:25187_t:CDS:2 [Gigaspora margarita]|uniref:25187_t:CDS:1 n=1 Tax=Gigaspora margarita TaxID=4874 RepID=A0ABN7W5P9_GIGMA|nr:25187_t:CDS:2 [Gigaspora margarita]
MCGIQDIIDFKPHDTEIFQATDRETGTEVVHRWTARINNKHTKLKEYGRRKVKRSTLYMAVLPSTTLGYDNNRKGILPCLEMYTTIMNPHSLSIAMKYRNSAGSHMLDRSKSHKGFPFTQTLFYLKHFLTSDRLMKIKYLHSTPAFQNGRIRSGKISTVRKRLYGINRYQRGFSPCTIIFRSPKVFRIQMQWEMILLYMSTLWAFNQSMDVHEDSLTSYGDGKTDEHKISSILGRYSYNGKILQASKDRQGETRRPTIQNGFQYKHQKIMARASLVNRVLRVYHKFKRNNAPNTQSQNKGVNSQMLSNVQKDKHSYTKTSIINRKAYSSDKCISTCSTIISRIIMQKNKQLKQQEWDLVVHLSSESKQQLLQWIEQLTHHKKRKVSVELPSTIIQTDTSPWGWGAIMNNQIISGRWSVKERGDHINLLDIKKILKSNSRTNMAPVYSVEYCDPGSTPSREDE